MWAAIDVLSTLQVGDRVEVTTDGRTYQMEVSQGIHRCDGQFGSVESSRVRVRLGPGRYNTEVTAERIADGQQTLSKL